MGRWMGQKEAQLPLGAPAPRTAPSLGPLSPFIIEVPSVIHVLYLEPLRREPHYPSCLTGEWCNSAGSPHYRAVERGLACLSQQWKEREGEREIWMLRFVHCMETYTE